MAWFGAAAEGSMEPEATPHSTHPRATMQFTSAHIAGAILLVLTTACSENGRDGTDDAANSAATGVDAHVSAGDAAAGGRGTASASGDPTSASAAPSGGAGTGSCGKGGSAGQAGSAGGTTAGVGGARAEADSGGGSGETGSAEAGAGGFIAAGGSPSAEDALFVPSSVEVNNLNGERRAVNVIAATLVQKPEGLELYAALENQGDVTGCDGSVSFEFFDESDQSVGSWVSALYAGQLFRRSDGTGAPIACIEPGTVAMTGLTDLPESLSVDEVRTVLYQLSYFDRDILHFELEPMDAIAVSELESVSEDSETLFTGTLENGLEVPIVDATVTVFPLSAVGRPLGMVTSNTTADVEPGESWSFETTTVDDAGVDYVVYPAGSVAF